MPRYASAGSGVIVGIGFALLLGTCSLSYGIKLCMDVPDEGTILLDLMLSMQLVMSVSFSLRSLMLTFGAAWWPRVAL